MKNVKVAVASKNPAKIEAVSSILKELAMPAEVEAVEVESGVSNQPFSQQETMQGAMNRARNALAVVKADMAFGLEGGVHEIAGRLYLCNWGALADHQGNIWTAAGAQIELPEAITAQLRNGKELGPVMDAYAGEFGIRRHKGAIGILTGGLINRSEMFGHIVKILMGLYLRNCD